MRIGKISSSRRKYRGLGKKQQKPGTLLYTVYCTVKEELRR
jgi:hypothetical protein